MIKRLITLVFLIMALPCGAQTLIQTCSGTATGGNFAASCTLTGVGPHHTIVVGAGTIGAIFSGVPSDTAGLGYLAGGGTQLCTAACNVNQITYAETGSFTGNDTITVSNNQFANNVGMWAREYSIPLTVDTSTSPNATCPSTCGGGATGNVSSGNLTTSQPIELLVAGGWFFDNSATPIITIGTGYGHFLDVSFSSGLVVVSSTEDMITSSAGTYSASFNIDPGTPCTQWQVVLVAFMPLSSTKAVRRAQFY